MKARRNITILCCLLSVLCAMTVKTYAQSSTASSATRPTDTMVQNAKEYAEDNIRLAASIKAQRAAKLLGEEIVDKLAEVKRLDSLNKALQADIDFKKLQLSAEDVYKTKQNNIIYEQNNELDALRGIVKNRNRDEKRGRKKIAITAGGGIGYDVLTGRRSVTLGVYAGGIIARL